MTKQKISTIATKTMQKLIDKYLSKSNPEWKQGKFADIIRVEKGFRGEVGEDFVVEMLQFFGYTDAIKETGRSSPTQKKGAFDIRVAKKLIEVKTATIDVSGKFQFNGIKYNGDTPYNLLFVLGIAADNIYFRIYRKKDIPPGLPSMAKNTPGTHKLMLKRNDMFSVEDFAEEAAKYLKKK